MDSIASELGISKKTIYQHFPDKDSMVLQVVECFIEEDLKKWEDLDAKYSNVIEKMFKSFEMLKEMLENMNPRLLYEIPSPFTNG
jgi:AcrR family transcriptional regulator